MRIVERRSPNHGPRRGGGIDMLLLHYTDMPRVADALDRLCDPQAQVSAHYVVGEDGTVWRLVPESERAWHAGVAWWAGETDINSRSIGIELSNPGHSHGYRRFPEAQMAAVESLCLEILARHPIPASRVLGHSDVSPGRKIDPGHLFDWRRLARAGIGLWPNNAAPADLSPGALVAALATIGYRTEGADPGHPTNRSALSAFRRHWCPDSLGKPFDRRLASVLASTSNEFKKT